MNCVIWKYLRKINVKPEIVMHKSTSLEIIYLRYQWFTAWLVLTLMPKISCILRVGIRNKIKTPMNVYMNTDRAVRTKCGGRPSAWREAIRAKGAIDTRHGYMMRQWKLAESALTEETKTRNQAASVRDPRHPLARILRSLNIYIVQTNIVWCQELPHTLLLGLSKS